LSGYDNAYFAYTLDLDDVFPNNQSYDVSPNTMLTKLGIDQNNVVTTYGDLYVTSPFSSYYDIPDSLYMDDNAIRKEKIEYFLGGLFMIGLFFGNEKITSGIFYLYEAYYYLPMYLGEQLCKNGYHQEALSWFQTVYDYRKPEGEDRHISVFASNSSLSYPSRPSNWLLDPLDPHSIAFSRNNNDFLKYTIRTIAECLIEYGNAEFTLDTNQSIARARELYQTALDLLNLKWFNFYPDACEEKIRQVIDVVNCHIIYPYDFQDVPNAYAELRHLLDEVRLVSKDKWDFFNNADAVKDIVLEGSDNDDYDYNAQLADAWQKYEEMAASSDSEAITIGHHVGSATQNRVQAADMVLAHKGADNAMQYVGAASANDADSAMASFSGVSKDGLMNPDNDFNRLSNNVIEEQQARQNVQMEYRYGSEAPFQTPDLRDFHNFLLKQYYQQAIEELTEFEPPVITSLGIEFCVPPNPAYKRLRMEAEDNLFKIRNCMNISGMQRETDLYSASTETDTNLPAVSGNGQLVLPSGNNYTPTEYHYEVIIERAKELVTMAQQVEGRFLRSLEKRDQEAYRMIKAEQDLELAKSNVKLQKLRVDEARSRVDLAKLKRDRAQQKVDLLKKMIDKGKLGKEEDMIAAYDNIAKKQKELAEVQRKTQHIQKYASIDPLGVVLAFAMNYHGKLVKGRNRKQDIADKRAELQKLKIEAAQARRKQRWEFQKKLAEHDIKIGDQQIQVAQDHVRVVAQQKEIADLKVGQAEDTINFLNNKFTSEDLYDWIAGVLEGVYAYFLQQATSMAKLAMQQLAFERQQAPPPVLQDNYWTQSTEGQIQQQPAGTESDRRGLTGSARLLQDIYKLDQYAFETDQRKLKQSKTFSLATYAPFAFQEFKQTGKLSFETLMEDFDRDFPGQYLRTIKRVSLNVIALTNPVDGVKATLSSSGISRVVTKGSNFVEQTINREPETITYTGTDEGQGLINFRPEDRKFLNPFEGTGVHTRWEFEMPHYSNFLDYDTIADILVTIEYTAFYDRSYEEEVISKMDREFRGDRGFTFSSEFADAFYELTNPEESDTPMEVEVPIERLDFPANMDNIQIDHFKLFFILDSDQKTRFQDNLNDAKLTINYQPDGQQVSATIIPNKEGMISTELGNAGNLGNLSNSKIGDGTLKLVFEEHNNPNSTISSLFKDGVIQDVMVVISYRGDLRFPGNQ